MTALAGTYSHYDHLFARPALGPAVVLPAAFGGGFPSITETQTLDDNDAIYSLCLTPIGGTLKDVLVWIGATASGNAKASVYVLNSDGLTFDKMWTGSNTAVSADAYENLGDPDISVEAGQWILLAVATDDATTTFGTLVLPNASASTLPDDFLLDAKGNGLVFPLGSEKATQHASPASTLVVGDVTATTYVPVIIARIDPLTV